MWHRFYHIPSVKVVITSPRFRESIDTTSQWEKRQRIIWPFSFTLPHQGNLIDLRTIIEMESHEEEESVLVCSDDLNVVPFTDWVTKTTEIYFSQF